MRARLVFAARTAALMFAFGSVLDTDSLFRSRRCRMIDEDLHAILRCWKVRVAGLWSRFLRLPSFSFISQIVSVAIASQLRRQ